MAAEFTMLDASMRALDLADEKGSLCGRILGDLGVDVIKVEPPGGDVARAIGPFFADVPGPNRSLSWLPANANKRGITLNIETELGRALFKRMVATADFVIESFEPGYLDELGLGYKELAQLNERVILTSISPFGQTGPRCRWRACDLISIATGGQMYLLGDPDRPPVRISYPQAYGVTGTYAAAGTLMAHTWREMTGRGQHVDVSVQASVIALTQDATLFWDLTHTSVRRAGRFRRRPDTGVQSPFVWQCADGHVAFAIIGGALGAPGLRALVQWMDAEQMADSLIKEADWNAFDWVTATQDYIDLIAARISAFFGTKTKKQLYEGAVERRIMLAPVSTAADIFSDRQLAERAFWKGIDHDDLGATLFYPGSFFRTSEGVPGIRCRAPRVGEHNRAIYEGEMRLAAHEMAQLVQAGVI